MRLCTIVCLVLVLAGCGVVLPRVQYAEYPKTATVKAPSDASGYQFRHRRSVIVVEYTNKSYRATAVPFELTSDGSFSTLYRVWGADDYRSTTQLKVSYIDNTKFIDQLHVTTKDNVADTISKIGNVAKASVPLATHLVSAPPGEAAKKVEFKKTMIDPTQAGIDQWTSDPLNAGYCVRLKVAESPLSLRQYVADGIGKWQGTFPVPACAIGIVEIAVASPCEKADANIEASILVKFADADKVLPISLPSSGSLKMNSVCGASVTEADKQDRTDLLDYLKAAITQTQDVYTAWNKAKTGKK